MTKWNRRDSLAGTSVAAFAPAARGTKLEATSKLYEFHGVADGDSMTGNVRMGEYGVAEWTAKRV